MQTQWRIELLGGLRAVRHDRAITHFRTRKTGALLAYLALHRQHRHARDELSALLWPDSELPLARHSLSQAISALKQTLEPPGARPGSVLPVDRETVTLNRESVSTDVAFLEEALRAAKRAPEAEREARLMAVIESYPGELLPGYFEHWAFLERQRLCGAVVGAYEALISLREQRGDLAAAIDLARAALRVDPLHEEVHTHLIRLLAHAGRTAEARRHACDLKRRFHEADDAPQQRRAPRPSIVFSPRPGGALPAFPTRFFDRQDEIATLCAMLAPGSRIPAPGRNQIEPGAGSREPGAAFSRLVTLTGPGGSGKTRLAVEVARRLGETGAPALCFASLADLEDACRIPAAIRDLFGLHRSGRRDAMDQVVTLLAEKPTLLVLDNFEHLVEVGTPVISQLLARVATLACLVTSRRRLGIAGEREFRVKPLAVCPGVRLFVDRAAGANPEFALTDANRAAIKELCMRLEGLPLAIELAAARAAVLTPEQMLEHLSHRFTLLVNPHRDAPERHRSLRSTLEWSYRLLPVDLQRFLARLSVFRSGWSAAAAEAVGSRQYAAGSGEEAPSSLPAAYCLLPTTLDCLARLRDDSFLQTEICGAEVRFRMLDTIREFAEEQLSPADREAAEQQHIEFYLALAERAAPELQGPNTSRWLDTLAREHENFRTALGRALQSAPGAAVRLGAALWRFWQVRGHITEGREYLERLLALPEAASGDTRARLLDGAGDLAADQGDHETAKRCFTESLAIRRASRDRAGMTFPLYGLANVALYECRLADARALFEENLAVQREVGDRRGAAISMSNLGGLAHRRADYDTARTLLTQSLSIQHEVGDLESAGYTLLKLAWMANLRGRADEGNARAEEALRIFHNLNCEDGIATALSSLAYAAHLRGDTDGARRLGEESLRRHQDLGNKRGILTATLVLGVLCSGEGQLVPARSRLEECIELSREVGDKLHAAWARYHLARLCRGRHDFPAARGFLHEALSFRLDLDDPRGAADDLEEAARLALCETPRLTDRAAVFATRMCGAAAAIRDAIDVPMHGAPTAEHEAHLDTQREFLGSAAFAAAWEYGRALPWRQAAAKAMDWLDIPMARDVDPNDDLAELTDDQWARIQPLLHSRRQDVGRPRADDRRILDGIRYVLGSGRGWRNVPRRYGSPTTCWRRWKEWQADGTWKQIEEVLSR